MNTGYTYRDTVRARFAGISVLDFYATRYPKAGREGWRERIANGQVRLNDNLAPADLILRAGDRLSYHRPPWEEPAAPTDVPVVFEDDALFVVNKPAGLPVLPGGGFLENTVVWLLRRGRSDLRVLSPAHCLDRGTSGLLLFGRNRAALSALGRALHRHRVSRVYLAVLEGIVAEDEFSIGAPIGLEIHPRLGPVHVACPTGKPSRTDFRVLERDESSQTTLVQATPQTGRTHQIRIHAAVAGHPLAGDPFYVRGGKWDAGSASGPGTIPLPGDGGFRLHAWQLEFAHPRTGATVHLSCPPPEGFWKGTPAAS